jgi:5-methylcytosine-specific restriction endonuclease McrA
VKTYPYKLQVLVWFTDRCELTITGLDDEFSFFNHCYPNGLTEDIVQFILEHGSCSFCGSKIKGNLDRCECGQPEIEDAHLKISYPTPLDKTFMVPLLSRERMRRVNHLRQQRIKTSGGKFTKKQEKELLSLQDNQCYYCGESFDPKNDKLVAHADHYVSIRNGGTNDIQNIVMACVTCNSKKGWRDGDSFERLIRKSRPVDVGRRLGVMRRRLNAHLRKLKALEP